MEDKLLRSARRFAKSFVGKPMGIVSSVFRMNNGVTLTDLLLLMLAVSWFIVVVYIFISAPWFALVFQSIQALVCTGFVAKYIKG